MYNGFFLYLSVVYKLEETLKYVLCSRLILAKLEHNKMMPTCHTKLSIDMTSVLGSSHNY